MHAYIYRHDRSYIYSLYTTTIHTINSIYIIMLLIHVCVLSSHVNACVLAWYIIYMHHIHDTCHKYHTYRHLICSWHIDRSISIYIAMPIHTNDYDGFRLNSCGHVWLLNLWFYDCMLVWCYRCYMCRYIITRLRTVLLSLIPPAMGSFNILPKCHPVQCYIIYMHYYIFIVIHIPIIMPCCTLMYISDIYCDAYTNQQFPWSVTCTSIYITCGVCYICICILHNNL